VLVGGAVVAGDGAPVAVDERDAAGDAIGPVLGDLDGRGAGAVVVSVAAGLDAVDGVAQRARGAVSNGPDDLVHPPPAGGDERLCVEVEDRGQPVGAVAGVLADAAIVVNGDLDADVAVAAVGDAISGFRVIEPDGGVAAVAERFELGGTATTQRHLRACRQWLTEPVIEVDGVGHQQRSVGGGLDARIQPGLQRLEFGHPGARRGALGGGDGEVLQGGGRLAQRGVVAVLHEQGGRAVRQLEQHLIDPGGGVVTDR
jgi:hypothetical protein